MNKDKIKAILKVIFTQQSTYKLLAAILGALGVSHAVAIMGALEMAACDFLGGCM